MAQGDDAVAWARAQIGKPYVWATAGPNSFDCSGLVYAAYRAISQPVHLGRTTYEMIFNGKEVSKDDLAVGDLVFPYSDISHVQIYSGGGNIIEAPNSSFPVRETQLTTVWRARRVGSTSGDDGESGTPIVNPIRSPDIPNPFEMAQQSAQNVATFWRVTTSPVFWARAGTVGAGVAMIIWGIAFLNRGLAYGAFNSVYSAGKSVLGGLGQGWAFGVGAGATGGIGGASTTVVNTPPASPPALPPVREERIVATVVKREPRRGKARAPRPIPRPSGLSDKEFVDRLARSPMTRRKGLTVTQHDNPLREGGQS